MGLFDSIRNAVGGSADDDGDDAPSLLDSTTLDPTDFRTRAEAVADADGLDFSRESLAHLDWRVASLPDPETADDAAAETTYADPALRYGSYLGEVLVRAYGGAWTRDGGWGVTVAGPDDEVTVAVFDVAARSLDGDPVFAAIVDRLEAELALGDDATTESDRPTPPADAGDATPDEGASDSAAAPGPDAPTVESAPERSSEAVGPERERSGGDDTEADDSTADVDVDADADADDGATAEADTDPDASDLAPDQDADDPAAAFIGEAESDAVESGDGAPSDQTPDATDAAGPTDGAASGGIDAGSDAASQAPGASGPEDGSAADPDDPTAGDGLRAEYAETAQEFAAFWSERDLDFDPDSLSRLDALVDDEWDAGRFRDATFGGEEDFDDRAFTSLVTELGSYFGEVLLRTVDGEWTEATDHGAAVVVATDSGPLAVPVFQVAENSLRQTAVFERSYEALLEDIGRDDPA